VEGLIILVLLLVVGAPVAIAIWAIVKLNRTARTVEELQHRIFGLELALRDRPRAHQPPPAAELPKPGPIFEPPHTPQPFQAPEPPKPPPMPVPPHIEILPESEPEPPPIPEVPELPTPSPAFNWEQFMGVKLFAWIGGFALFLGLVFFLKYAFENKLISPELQVALEYLVGAGLLIGGVWLQRKNYAVTGQTLCATAVVALYAITFAAHGYYHLLGVLPAFAVMVLVTATAFLLAVRLDAQVVAILGLLGGFLTPIMLSTGKDNPLGLFSYLALLDVGLIAVVNRKRWNYQLVLAAAGTVFMQFAWAEKFFTVDKTHTAIAVFLTFELLFLIAFYLCDRDDVYINAAAIGVALVPLVFALMLLNFRELGEKPWIIFSFILAADLGALVLVLLRCRLATVHLAAGGAVFCVLAIWTGKFLTPALLNWALGFYFLFAVLHAVFPVVLQKIRPGATPVWWGQLFPPIALLLVLLPVLKLPELSWLVWVCVLALDTLVFALAFITASLFAIIGALVLTLVVIGAWVLHVPVVVFDLPATLVVVGGFALVFFGLGIFAARRLAGKLPGLPGLEVDVRAQIPAFSAVLPFLLLIMVVLRVPIANPSPVFGLALLLVVLLLGVARWTSLGALTMVGLVSTAALEYAWDAARFKPEYALVALPWYLTFTAIFTVFPFLFRRQLKEQESPWAAAALAGPAHFTLVYQLVKTTWPNPVMGLLPAAFALPPLIGLIVLLRGERKLSHLAWFGGATLFFVTLIFPIQFDRQWITIGWALEGAALLWLWHRVPHNGLRWVGVGLLCVAFGRLALNPDVLEYHPRSAQAIWNWYLYSYGIVTAALFIGAKLVSERRAAVLLATLGTVLAFLLLNIEIADYFTAAGARTLTFQFSGNFARDMTYSIAWALFALTLLVAGIAKKIRPARYASLALLGVTLLKLFLHDLGRLNQLYRIGAFVGVAVILLIASFLYQKFVPVEKQ